jgi:O-antigen/teichoic acid export membrane protein
MSGASGRTAGRRSLLPVALVRIGRGGVGRVSWGLADQAVSSLTNFAVGITVARSLGAEQFGVFSLAWVTYGVVLNISRGLATDPLTVRFSAVPAKVWHEGATRAAGTALLTGVASGAAVALVGVVVGGDVGWAFIALGIVLPALLLQDSWRFAFFAAGRGARSCANDLVWAAALVPAMFLAAEVGTVTAFLLAWGGSAAVAAVVGALQIRDRPRVGGARSWFREQHDLGLRYLVENVSNSGGSQIRMYGLGAIAGLADVGTTRGADLLMGPFLAVLMGLTLVTVPEAARVLARSPRRLPQFCLLLGGGQLAAALLWGAGLLLVLPESVGEWLLGEVWPAASTLIVPATLSVMGASMFTGAAAGLRALGAARRSLRAQLLASVAYVTGGLVGAAMGGALGSSWGAAIATAIGAIVWWHQLYAGLADHRRAAPAQPDPTPEPLDNDEMRTP